jgi:hypothetical protein
MQNTPALRGRSSSHLLAIACTLGLVVPSFLIWGESLDRQPTPLGAWLRLAALALVVMWSHFLVWLFRRMSRQEISSAYCSILFFGAWAIFFLIYNCLV